MYPELTHLHEIAELDRLLAESAERPVLFFKHSYSCGTSAEALDEILSHLDQPSPAEASRRRASAGKPGAPAEASRRRASAGTPAGAPGGSEDPPLQVRRGARYAIVTVQTDRAVSDAMSVRLGVRHETPQALLVRDGRVVWSASHFRVTADAIARAIASEATHADDHDH